MDKNENNKISNTFDSLDNCAEILDDINEQKKKEEALLISEASYKIAMSLSDITMFEYDIVTHDIVMFDKEAESYAMPNKIVNGVETLINKGVILPDYAEAYRDMFNKVSLGAPNAKCYIKAQDRFSIVHDYDISLAAVYDASGKAIRAIGVRKNVTELRELQKENEYRKTMFQNQTFIYEANVTKDEILARNFSWSNDYLASSITTFSGVVKYFADNYIAKEHREIFSHMQSPEYIACVYNSGQSIISFEYRKKSIGSGYKWYRVTINIIKDIASNDITIRCYHCDVNERKLKELKVLNEHKIYEALLSKASVVYDVNISKNRLISGQENWKKWFDIDYSSNYSDMVRLLGQKAVHPDDLNAFNTAFLQDNVLTAFANGETQIEGEYRRPNERGEFAWVRCTMHLFQDDMSLDVKGQAYIEDIDEEKRHDLDLIYLSEHDSLTDMYNKASTEKYITEFFGTSEAKVGKHAFFIIDIDYFKNFNDNFGHAFGDAILSKVSSKIKELFRDNDILGRIGGDEFVVLMKNIQSEKLGSAKAIEMLGSIKDSYNRKGYEYDLSISIGIAFYDTDGKTYDELYRMSDTALYISKLNGRNQFTLYNDSMEYRETIKNEIISNGITNILTFEKGITEHVLHILSESDDKATAIKSVLELIGKHYNLSRTYICEDSADGKTLSNTFEWCANGILPMMDSLQNVKYSYLGKYKEQFDDNGIFFLPDVSEVHGSMRNLLTKQAIKSMLQFAIVRQGEIKGFVGADECAMIRAPSKQEITELRDISTILGIVITEMRAEEDNIRAKNIAVSIIEGLDSFAYVCNPDTYELLFVNKNFSDIAPLAVVGSKCYRSLWNRDSPCERCPMRSMISANSPRYTAERFNDNLKIWAKVTASQVDWIDKTKMCLINCVDITKYK